MQRCTGPRPRLYLYNSTVGIPPWHMTYDGRLEFLTALIERSPHYTPDGHCADFFVVHNYVADPERRRTQPSVSNTRVLQLFHRLPFYNAATRGRHLLISPCDHGPGDCMFERTSKLTPPVPPSAVQWADLDPHSSSRRIAFIELSGAPKPNPTRFVRGLDIRLPASDMHQCGPWCGTPHLDGREQRALRLLRRYSPWYADGGDRPRKEASLRVRRRHRLFFAGRATKGGDRGDMFRLHQAASGFLLHDTSGLDFHPRPKSLPSLANESRRPDFFARAMANSDFCFSPLGQSDGDSDRYLPAALYGCVPVFSHEGEAPPLAEVLDWPSFSITLERGRGKRDQLHSLPAFLESIPDERLQRMRRAMASAWPRLLWRKPPPAPRLAGASFSYLGEDGRRDAFAAFISTLRLRLRKERAID